MQYHSSRPWDGVKFPLFQNMTMLYIKLKGMTNAVTCKQIFCSFTHPRPLRRGQRSKHFCEIVILHIEFMGLEYTALCKHIFCPYTHPRSLGGFKRTFFFTESSHVLYQIKGMEHRSP